MEFDKQKVNDSFQAYLVKGATFTELEEYPILQEGMISNKLPIDIIPFNEAIIYKGDLSKTFICFYEPDDTFERIRKNPRRYLNFFKRTAGIIGFDYSVHSDMPIIKQKSQMNDNISLTYYYGSNGIPIIPNIRCGIDELIPEYLETIPKQSIVAVGTHGFIKTKREKCEWYCFLDTIIKKIMPRKIIIYGTLYGKIFEDIKQKQEFVLYDSWLTKRRKGIKLNGN